MSDLKKSGGSYGYTLIEVAVYVAVLMMLVAVAVTTILSMQRSLAEIRVTRAVNASAAVAVERMVRVIRDASLVSTGTSVFDVSPGILSLVGPGANPETYVFSVTDGTLNLVIGTAPRVALTPPGVSVTRLVFRHITASSTEGVKIELTLTASSGRATTTQNFWTSVMLRNSYE